jgi:cobalt-zinc-cadmium efflux system membrane fusion protein
MRTPPASTFASLVTLLAGAACHDPPSSAATPPPGAPNEVLVGKEQIAQMKIAVATVGLEDVDDSVLASGKVAFQDQKLIHVFSPVTGRVAKVFVQLGDRVKKGDPLLAITSPDVGIATSDVGKAKADLIAAEHEMQRQKDLLALHAAAPKDYEAAADAYRKAKAEMERAAQKAALFRQGDVVGQTYTLRAEIDGEVFVKNVSTGMEIGGQYTGANPVELFTIGQADQVWVFADVYELDIPRVKYGSKVVVNVPSWPGRDFSGAVDWISSAIDPSTHATKVRCSFDNRDGALKPEMFATINISVDVKKAIAIPRSAVLRLGDQTVVFLDRGAGPDGRERFERVPLLVDEGEGSKWLTVEHGLAVGDRVVTGGAILLSGNL